MINSAQTPTSGTLFLVSTPIGNLGDITYRAVQTLKDVDFIYAEDTRHTRKLLNHLEIVTATRSYHQHNEAGKVDEILAFLKSGKSIALVSDAGTPLISDPGFKLVSKVREEGLMVSPVPGACAVIAGLSVSGLPTQEFSFYGFLPAKEGGRISKLKNIAS